MGSRPFALLAEIRAAQEELNPTTQESTENDLGTCAAKKIVLVQTSAAEGFEIVLPVGVPLERYVVRDPCEREFGLRAAQCLERGRGNLRLAGHSGGGGKHAVARGVIFAKTG